MQTVEVHLWDDLHDHQDGGRVPADVQVELTYKTRNGTRHVRLDLTEAHLRDLDKVLAPFLDAGQPPGSQAGATTKNGGKIRRGPPGGPGGTESRRWREGLRAWADGLGLVNRVDPGYPAWQTVTGKHYYPADLEDAYTLHLDGREAEAVAVAAKFKPQAA